MPKAHISGVWRVPGEAGRIYEKAGFHPSHALAIQSVANDLERIIVSRCAATVAIQLLNEGYASKGFGIKAKSCDWGPFAGFAMSHVHYAKFSAGSDPIKYEKQKAFFEHGREDTGFSPTDHKGRQAPLFGPFPRHSSMAAPDILKLSEARLKYLREFGFINFRGEVRDGAMISCNSPFGPMQFILVNLHTGSSATWGILHRDNFGIVNQNVIQIEGGTWTLARGMCNTSAAGSASDPHRQCCTGDYDLWGVFPKRNSSVANTRSLAKHGMDRQMQSFSAAVSRPIGAGIKDRIKSLQAATRNQAVNRVHHQYGAYKEDREKGNISALTLHTAREMNRRIKANGYKGGEMFHHNDDLGNPFRNDVESELIAFIPGHMSPVFIESDSVGRGKNGSIGWNQWVRQYEQNYVIYDNPAIHRIR